MIWYSYNGELYHHGIKGQKWGLRRFQNEDGTLTARGKKREQQQDNGGSDKKKTMKKILVATVAAAAVVGAAYAGKKYFDSQKTKNLMNQQLMSDDRRVSNGKGILSGLFSGKTNAQKNMKIRIKSDKVKQAAASKQSLLDRTKLTGMSNKKDIKKYMKGGKQAQKLVKSQSLKDKAYLLGIKEPSAVKKFIKDNM